VIVVFYDKFRDLALSYRHHQKLNYKDKFMIGSATGIVSCLVNTPFDMLRTQAQKDNPLQEHKIIMAAKEIFKVHGMRGFYSSLVTRMLRSTWYSAVTLLTMDYLNALPNRMKL